MTAFAYQAARLDGERVRGVLEATSRAAALAELTATGLMLLDVREDSGERPRAQRYRRAELATVLSGLASLLEAGLPIDRALAVAAETATSRLRPALDAVQGRVRDGAAVSEALGAGGACPASVVATVKAGEANGRLPHAVRSAADGLAREAELASQLRAALAYPAFLLTSGTVAIVIIVAFVVPRFASLLADLEQGLPASTRFLLTASSAVAEGWPYATVALLVVAVLVRGWRATQKGGLWLDRIALEVPLVGPVAMQLASSRVCRTLGELLQSGVPALGALAHAGAAGGNADIEQRMARARGAVSEGQKVWWSLRRHGVLTETTLQLVRFGEESGRLGPLAVEAGRQEEAAAYRSLRTLVALLEPALIVVFGAVVAFVALALLQAVYAVRPAGF